MHKLVQSQNFQTAITQSFLKSKFMKKSADIEKDLLSLNLQKKFKMGKIFVNLFENQQFLK